MHGFVIEFGLTILGIPLESLLILLYTFILGWPSLQCQVYVMSGSPCVIWYDCILAAYRSGGINAKLFLIYGFPSMSCIICKVYVSPCFLVCSWYLFAHISWKLIRLLVEVGAYIAAAMLIPVPPNNIMVAFPLPYSIWFGPTMVVIDVDDGVITLKYLLCFRIISDVPLLMIPVSGSSRDGYSRCALICSSVSLYAARSSSISM